MLTGAVARNKTGSSACLPRLLEPQKNIYYSCVTYEPDLPCCVDQFLAPTLSVGKVVVMDTFQLTRSLVFAPPSQLQVPVSSTCRPTRPT